MINMNPMPDRKTHGEFAVFCNPNKLTAK